MDLYTDIERSIQQSLVKGMLTPPLAGLAVAIFNNQVTKKDFANQHAAISIMKVSDVFQPANSGGTGTKLRTPVLDVDGNASSYTQSAWPDPYDLLYQLTVSAETCSVGGVAFKGIEIVRAVESMIRDVFRPRQPMYIWDSSAGGGAGAWSTNYVDYVLAGYINRDSPQTEIYNRVINIRFEAFSYSASTATVPAITDIALESDVDSLNTVIPINSTGILPPSVMAPSGLRPFQEVPQPTADPRVFTLTVSPVYLQLTSYGLVINPPVATWDGNLITFTEDPSGGSAGLYAQGLY